MTTTKIYSYTEASLTVFANQAKELIIAALHAEGLLKEGSDIEEVAGKYALVVHRKGWLGERWDEYCDTGKEDGLFFAIVKSVIGNRTCYSVFDRRGGGETEEKKPHLKVVPINKKEEL